MSNNFCFKFHPLLFCNNTRCKNTNSFENHNCILLFNYIFIFLKTKSHTCFNSIVPLARFGPRAVVVDRWSSRRLLKCLCVFISHLAKPCSCFLTHLIFIFGIFLTNEMYPAEMSPAAYRHATRSNYLASFKNISMPGCLDSYINTPIWDCLQTYLLSRLSCFI